VSTLTKREALQLLERIIIKVNNPTPTPEWTLEDFVHHTVFPLFSGKWKHSTHYTTTERFRTYLLPAFGTTPLRSISRSALQEGPQRVRQPRLVVSRRGPPALGPQPRHENGRR
jgi:hypothetical protein